MGKRSDEKPDFTEVHVFGGGPDTFDHEPAAAPGEIEYTVLTECDFCGARPHYGDCEI